MITEPLAAIKLDSAGCRALLPHRDTMALLDGVSWYAPEARQLRGYKRIATSEFSVRGHFPQMPIFPPVFVIEVLAQACGIMMNMERMRDQDGVDLLRLEDPSYRAQLPPIPLSVLAESTIKQFARVFPGDTLEVDVRIAVQRQEFRYFKVAASVGDQQVAEGSILLSYPNYLDFEH